MSSPALLIIATICYLFAGVMVFRFIRSQEPLKQAGYDLRLAFSLASIAALCHFLFAYQISGLFEMLNISFSAMCLLISAALVLIYLLGSLAIPIKRLGVLVFPFAALCLIVSYYWHSEPLYLYQITNQGGALRGHILVSILAYCLLTIAVLQALLYAYQEKQIKLRSNPNTLIALPPLQTMEQLLFGLVVLGFIFLSLTLFSGMLFSQTIFGHAFELKHHTVLAILGWCVYLIYLFKRIKNGTRGGQALLWVSIGFILIQLGYFGTKIVSESLN